MIEQFIQETFANTSGWNALLAVVIGAMLFTLSLGADKLVEGAVDAARDLGLPKIIIGATIVSLGTTSPEVAVSVMAAFQGKPGLAIGNGVGSVICNVSLILGLAIVLSRIPIHRRYVGIQSSIMLGTALLLMAFAWGSPTKTITRPMGIVMVLLLAVYLYGTYVLARRTSGQSESASVVEAVEEIPDVTLAQNFVKIIGGLAVLILSSKALIPSVSLAAVRIGIPEAVIAATLVAFGTSLPELMTAISAVRKGHPELTLGNILGANALNVLFVIGLSAIAVPLKVEPVFYHIQGPMMTFMLALFLIYSLTTRGAFRRWQGVSLLALYVFFVVVQYFG